MSRMQKKQMWLIRENGSGELHSEDVIGINRDSATKLANRENLPVEVRGFRTDGTTCHIFTVKPAEAEEERYSLSGHAHGCPW
jgi:peptide methionine sulfoxide reductase MsrB